MIRSHWPTETYSVQRVTSRYWGKFLDEVEQQFNAHVQLVLSHHAGLRKLSKPLLGHEYGVDSH